VGIVCEPTAGRTRCGRWCRSCPGRPRS